MTPWTLYHIGHLAPDRARDDDLHTRAARLYVAAVQGKVTLAQRRDGTVFRYLMRPIKGA